MNYSDRIFSTNKGLPFDEMDTMEIIEPVKLEKE
jgi:hypothetical protein